MFSLLIAALLTLAPQTATQGQSFDAVSLKRAQSIELIASGCRGVDAGPTGVPRGRCWYMGHPLTRLIRSAYSLGDFELVNASGWMDSDLYSLEGVASDTATVRQQQLLVMLQHQLEESFKLKFHREARMM